MPSIVVDGDRHVAKRQRIEGPKSFTKSTGSRIFAPYRTLGLVSPTSVPFTYIPLGKTTFQVTTSTGKCLHTYDLKKGLQLVFITRPETPYAITATCAHRDVVFAAWGGGTVTEECSVWIFKRGKKIAELDDKASHRTDPIDKLVVFGSWIVGCSTSQLDVWKSDNYEHYTTISGNAASGYGASGFSGSISNMPTYLNKIIAGKNDGSVEIWNISTGKLLYTIAPPDLECGAVTAMQPAPVINLLAIGRADGSIRVHNVLTDKEILKLNHKGTQKSDVTSISFRTDDLGAGKDGQEAGVMATAGRKNGDITLWDLNKGGRVIGVLRNAHNPPSSTSGDVVGGVTRASFLPGQAVIVSSGLDNSIKSWIFDDQPFSPIPRILHNRSGHASSITRLKFLPTNSDGSDDIGKWLLSAGRDQSLWGWSLRRDGQSTELSQGNITKKARKLGFMSGGLDVEASSRLEELKAPEIVCMACCLNRDGGMGTNTGGGPVWANVAVSKLRKGDEDKPVTGWESVVTGHRGDKFARTWFWGRKKAGRWAFETSDGTEVRSVAMSACGTFALVGSAGGSVDMFNLQSGMHRQKFPAPISPAQARKLKLQQQNGDPMSLSTTTTTIGDPDGGERTWAPGQGKHKKAVTGITVDGLNRTAISCGLDGKIKFWEFHTGMLRNEIDWSPMAAITAMRHHRASDLLALSCDDLSIRVVDASTRKLAREFWGCAGEIRDLCFSPDGRLLVAASMDRVVRTWDLPTGHLVDAFRVESAATALAFSPTGEFLATAHADSIGIGVWSNGALFRPVSTRQINERHETRRVALPGASGEGGRGLLEAAFASTDEKGDENDEHEEGEDGDDTVPPSSASLDQLSAGITTLSLVPRSRWQTLLHLDSIALRNKPQEAPKAPERAPFFLPSVGDTSFANGNSSGGPSLLGANTTNAIDGAGGISGGATASLAAATNTKTAVGAAIVAPPDVAAAVSGQERSRISALQRHANAASTRAFTALLHATADAPLSLSSPSAALATLRGTVSDAAADGSALSDGALISARAGTGIGTGVGQFGDANNHSWSSSPMNGVVSVVEGDSNGHEDNGGESQHEAFVAYFKSLSPAAADVEIRFLRGKSDEEDVEIDGAGNNVDERVLFVRALTRRLRLKRDYEVIQAWMAVFLKVHGEALASDDELRGALREWRSVQAAEAKRLGALVGYCAGVVGFLRSAR